MSQADTDDALKLWVVLSRAYGAVAARVKEDVTANDLTSAEFGALEALYHKGPLLLGDLQRKILVSSGGITYLVDRLAGKGLAERRPCAEDRRASYAALTDEGRALMDRIFPRHAEVVAEALRGLDAEETRAATALLRKMGRGAEEG